MEWTRGPIIGRGTSATVSVATTSSGELFAVKSTDLSSSSLLQKEQFIISQLDSPYVIKCLGSDITCEENKSVFNLFLEYFPGGALSDQIRKQGGSLDESIIQFYAHQMVRGFNYLHLNGVVHGDIKGQNILIGEDGLKIADFGCSKLIQEDDDSVAGKSRFSGTPAYMAPEVSRGEEQGFPADIWALGCTVIEMATGCSPWPEIHDPVSALYKIGYSGDAPEIPSWLSNKAKEFLSKCLIRDAKLRWTAEELLEHSFFHGLEDNCGEAREFTRKSPTSVLDQGFWDSMEAVPEYSSPNLTVVASSSDSPADRISRLISDSLSINSNIANWTPEEEDWITVRGIDIEANFEVPENSCNFIQDFGALNSNAESFIFMNVNEEELQVSIAVEDSLFDCFSYDISFFDSLGHESIKDLYVSRILNFYAVIIHGNFFAIQFFLQSDPIF
ncbi:mitogen-activated protein kinase kinase kinase 16 [Forsythia ovata]|uniref:Mitogen-activated protein kinase kinase kinase 16 n=1 Tax=Forsythia ovata TaxID=205694 RepID=A0ABD1QB06_9LAMI